MPDNIVFGRILPACGLMLFMSTMYYAWLAYQLAKKTGRSDVTALPSGTSVPHMFVVVFVIMLPIALKTGKAIGFAQSPVVALACLGVAGVMFGCAKYSGATPKPAGTHPPHGAVGQPAT